MRAPRGEYVYHSQNVNNATALTLVVDMMHKAYSFVHTSHQHFTSPLASRRTGFKTGYDS
jgi:hypothetical protein